MTIIPIVKFLGTTFTIEGGKIALSGAVAQAAWWWVFLIVAAVAALAVGITAAVKAAENNSAEKKLDAARGAAEAAAEAADKMTASYENLRDSLEDIGNIQTDIDRLAYGTDSWRNSVEKLNDEVLKLIQEYPELAKFVTNDNGVLRLDVDSTQVQQALSDAKDAATQANIVATGAQLNVLQATDQATYESLNSKAKLGYVDPEAAAGWAYAGAMLGSTATGVGVGQLGWFGGPVLAAITSVLGGIGGLATGIATGANDAAAEEAAEAARSANEKSQLQTEQLARALANGDIIDTGSGFRTKDGMTDEDLRHKYSELSVSQLEEFYNKVGDSADALIEFGRSLNETREQSRGFFESISTQILSTIDQSNWNKSAQAIAGNIIDGNLGSEIYDDILEGMAEEDLLDKNLSDELVKRRTDAITAAYGSGAKLKEREDGEGYDIVGADGKAMVEKVTSDSLKNIIASTEAKAQIETTAQKMPEITQEILAKLGGDEEKNKALIAALSKESGEELTKEQLELLKFSESELKTMFDQSDLLKEAFGSIENFKNTILNPIYNANTAFGQTDPFFSNKGLSTGGLSSGALLGLADEKRMGSLYQRGTTEEITLFQSSFNQIMDNYENAEEIAQYMNTINWDSQEDLQRMQYELHEQFGVGEEDARNLADSMILANNATSNLTTTIEVFGDFYRATEKLNAQLEKTADLQWKYERMLKNGAKATELAANLEEQRQSILASGYQALDAYEAARANQAKVYAKGVNVVNGVDLTQYVDLDKETGIYDVAALQDRINAMTNQADKDAATKWMDELVKANELAEDQLDTAKEAYVQLEELNETAEESYWSLYSQIADLIVSEIEEEISLQSDLLDATQSANDKLISKLQEQIDSDRQDRENEKTEQSIADLQNQAAYLGMDSSGANALALLDLEKQIAEEQQAYQDTLVDQSIQSLQDANEKAAEQRERQISLAEQQLESYKKSEEFQSAIQTELNKFLTEIDYGTEIENTELGKRLAKSEDYQKLINPNDQQAYWDSLKETGTLAGYFKDMESNTDGAGDKSMATLLSSIDTNIASAAAETSLSGNYAAVQEKAQEIKSKTGFEYTLPEFQSYYDTDGNFNANSAKTDIVNANNAYTVIDTLQQNNSEGAAKHSNYQVSETLFSDKMLSETDFYSALNRGDTVSAGGKDYTSGLLQSSLAKQSTAGDYKDYVDTFVSSRYGEKNQLQYIEDQFTEAMEGTTPERQSGEVAFRGWETIATRHSDLINAYSSAGGNIDTLKQIFEDKVYKKNGASGAIYLDDAKTRDLFAEGGIGDLFDTIQHFTAVVGGKGGTWGAPSSEFICFEWDSSNSGDVPHDKIKAIVGDQPEKGWAVMVDGHPYIYDEEWRKVTHVAKGGDRYAEVLRGYKTGGLADFTGPAWLDGTPSRPEYILNANQTERFFSLVDVLEGIDKDKGANQTSGDNYFDINISVDKLENDYDVEQMVDKIRRMIYEDATYRNVNAINLIR